MAKRPPLKVIEWEDAYNGNHSWIDPDTIPDKMQPMTITTAGFEVRRCKERVTLAMSWGDDGDPTCCDLFTIPVAMIRKERVIR